MNRGVLRLAQLPLAATGGLVLALLWLPGRRDLALRVYLLVLAAFGLLVLLRALRRANPVPRTSPFDRGLRRMRSRRAGIEELARLEREVALAKSTGFDVHLRLRPRVRRIAVYLLASRRGVDLDSQPEVARRLLGERTWELVRADRPAPTDRHAPGLDTAALHEIVSSLERVS